MKPTIKHLLRWSNVLFILATFLAYLSPFVSPESFWFLSFCGMAYPWFLLGNLIFVGIWLFLKKRYFLFSLTCIIMGWNHLFGFIGLNVSQNAPPQSIRVMTYNTHGLHFIHHAKLNTRETKTNELFSFMNTYGEADILCTQETNNYATKLIKERFQFPHQHQIPYIGTAIFSRFPIIKTGNIEFKTKVNSCIWADVSINGKTVRVYSVHLQSNQVSGETEKVMSEGQIRQKETWSSIRSIVSKVKYTSRIRAQQAETIAAHIHQSPHPVIVCGDFNETPQSYAYRLLSSKLKDSFKEKGLGFGTTYAGSIPALRIDYILTSPIFQITDHRILKKAYSDHYPVTSSVLLNTGF